MYSTKKNNDIQVYLTGSGVYMKNQRVFPRNYSDWLWCLPFLTAVWIYCVTTIVFMANAAYYCWSGFFRTRILW